MALQPSPTPVYVPKMPWKMPVRGSRLCRRLDGGPRAAQRGIREYCARIGKFMNKAVLQCRWFDLIDGGDVSALNQWNQTGLVHYRVKPAFDGGMAKLPGP